MEDLALETKQLPSDEKHVECTTFKVEEELPTKVHVIAYFLREMRNFPHNERGRPCGDSLRHRTSSLQRKITEKSMFQW